MSTATVPTPVSATLTDLLDRARPASSLAAEQPLSAPTFPRWKGTAGHLSSRLVAAVAVVLALLAALVAPALASGLDGSPAEHASEAGAASAEAHPALQSPDVETRVRASDLAGGTRVGAETADLASAHLGSTQVYDPAPSGWLVAPRGPLAPTRTTVNSIAERGGVGLDGVKVHILDPVADADTIRYLDMQGAVARTDDLGIQLHPGAFADEETLLRTLAHERTHVYQLQTFPNYGTGHMGAFESAAYGIEDSFWQFFLRGGQ